MGAMHRLQNVVQPYAWGSRTAIAELLGQPSPSEGPQAELWMGAHPAAPSRVAGTALSELVEDSPQTLLGERVAAAFGPTLPFLLKVLAAAEPLSLQAHPTRSQAEAGFEADERAGIPIDARHRNYRDRNHKPELLCALTPFEALCGFRQVERTLELLDAIAVDELEFVRHELVARPNAAGLRHVFVTLMQADRPQQHHLVATTVAACGRPDAAFQAERSWAVRLNARYPGDIGAVSSLLLNRVRLEPGEAIFLPAGNLHAYLDGVGVEIMASSDNVLRGGLTPKHVNVPELVRILDFTPLDPPRIVPRETAGELVYDAPAPEFRLGRIELDQGRFSATPTGPEIVLCTRGTLWAQTAGAEAIELPQGASVFVPAATPSYSLSGRGTAFRARVP